MPVYFTDFCELMNLIAAEETTMLTLMQPYTCSSSHDFYNFCMSAPYEFPGQ